MSEDNYSFLRIFYEFFKSPFLKRYLRILKMFFSDYVVASYKRSAVTNIALDIDALIPEASVVRSYLDLFYLPIVLSARAHMCVGGDSEIMASLHRSFNTLEDIYRKTCSVYKKSQTTFKRKPASSISIKILRFFDRNRNCYPSLHAQVIAEIYNTFLNHEAIIKKDELSERVAMILEACFLTKQHSIQDIAAGLSGVSFINTSFTKEKAKDLISLIFKNRRYGMTEDLCNDIRARMVAVYDSMTEKLSHTIYEDAFLSNIT